MKDYTEELESKLEEERAKNAATQETLLWYQDELLHQTGEKIVESGVIGMSPSQSASKNSNRTFQQLSEFDMALSRKGSV